MDRPDDVVHTLVENVVENHENNTSVADKGNSKTVEDEVIVRKNVDKGKGIMVQDDSLVKKKRKALSRGYGIVITENENPSFDYDSDGDSDTNHASDNDNQMNWCSESSSEESNRSFDYLSDGDDELLELRKRRLQNKNTVDDTSEDQIIDNEPEKSSPLKRVVDISDNDTLLEHEAYMEALMKKLRGSECGMKDPFTIVEKSGDKYPVYDKGTHWKMRKPKIGEKYANGDKFKECLTYYALANGFSLWFYRSSKEKIIAKCGQRKEKLKDPSKGKQRSYKKFPCETSSKTDCPWRCYGKLLRGETSFQVSSMVDEHTCVRNFHYGRLVNYKWIGKHFGDKIRANPKITLHEIADLVMKKYSCIISPNQCRSAKTWALNEGDSAIQDHYGMVRSYAKALLESNVGSTVKVGVTVNPDDKTYFERFYVCLHGLKEGWKLGCRKIIALDGCFLKKPNSGEILTAVGRDGNNHIYPVAWAIVTVENKDNWRWFLDLLGDDLDVQNGHGLTLMSDQHKGLIEAVKEVMPLAEHRQCARHIYEGFRKSYSGVEFRALFWAASKASYPQMHNKIMDKIKRSNPCAHQYLLKKDPKTWSRAFFQEGCNCEAVENGFSECFNAVLLTVRHKPIITLLESMRVIVMERMNTMRIIMEKWTGDICPNIQKILEQSKDQQRFWHVIPSGGNKFEVRRGSDAFRVDEGAKTCSCRMWQLSGLPCAHAIACIFKLNKMVEDYVPECFKKDMYIKAYGQYLQPVDGITFWPDCSHMSRVLGPIPRKMPGRPRKKRIRASHEKKSNYKISRAGVQMTCHKCGEKGHNKKGCKNEPVPKTPKVSGKLGRPKKKVPVETTNLVDEDDIPRFVNTEIDEHDRGAASSNHVVYNNVRRIELGRNWDKNKRCKSTGNSYVKVRGGKTKSVRKILAANAGNVLGTQESQVVGVDGEGTSNGARRTEVPRTRGGRSQTSGMEYRARRSANAQADQQRTGRYVDPQELIPHPIQEGRAVVPLLREKSQRIFQKKVSHVRFIK